jgi:hypothetical protein
MRQQAGVAVGYGAGLFRVEGEDLVPGQLRQLGGKGLDAVGAVLGGGFGGHGVDSPSIPGKP